MSVAVNYSEEDEATAVERIDALLKKRTAQQRYVAQGQAEVVGRMDNLLIIDVELERAKAWLDRIYGRTPRPTPNHAEFMGLLDDIDERRNALLYRHRG